MAGGVMFNIILIYTILWARDLRTNSNTFTIYLAVVDILTAVPTLPFDTDFLPRGHYSYGAFVCGLKETILMFSLPSSMVGFLLLTLERFMKISYPHRYPLVFTKRNSFILILFSWIYHGIIAMIPIIHDRNASVVKDGKCVLELPRHFITYQIAVNFFTPLVFIVIMNFMIFMIAKGHAICIHKQTYTVCKHKTSLGTVTSSYILANYKAAKTIMMLVGVFLVCWLTYAIQVTINVLCNNCHLREITWMMYVINVSSIAINPLLYGFRDKAIRDAVTRQLYWKI